MSGSDQDHAFADGRGGFCAVAVVGLVVTTFGLGAWSAGADFFTHLDQAATIGVVAASASTMAAIAAAYSAYFTREGAQATRQSASAGLLSAQATRDTVVEMREARKEEQRPRLTLERKFLDFAFVCPGGINNGPLFRARTDYDPPKYALPHFELTNHSEAPALDVSLEFRLEDANGDFELHKDFNTLGVRTHPSPVPPGQASVEMIMFGPPVGGGAGYPLYRCISEYLPFCGPRQARLVDLPTGLLATLFARGLQYRERQLTETPLQPIVLVVEVSCYTVGKDQVQSTFRFEAFPFCYGPSIPLEVHGHFRELPNNPINDRRPS